MTTNGITETLTEIRDAVEVPTVDQVAFQRLVVRERRRRTTGRVLLASAAVVALTAGVGLAVQLDNRNDTAPAGQPEQSRAAFVPMKEPIPYLRDHMLQIRLPDGTTADTGEQLEEILGLTGQGVIAVGKDSELLLLPLRDDGQTGPVTPLIEGPVDRAWLSKDRTTIAWTDPADVVHVRELGADEDYWSGPISSPERELLAVDGDHWVEGDQDRLALRYVDVALDVQPVDGVSVVELAGSTLAVGGPEGVEMFSAVDGSPTWPGGVGGGEGALSPDGSAYAAGYVQSSVEQGASQIFEVIDAGDGTSEAITLVDYDGVLDLSWTGTNFLALVTHNGKNSVLECSAEALACEELIRPTTDPLLLPAS